MEPPSLLNWGYFGKQTPMMKICLHIEKLFLHTRDHGNKDGERRREHRIYKRSHYNGEMWGPASQKFTTVFRMKELN